MMQANVKYLYQAFSQVSAYYCQKPEKIMAAREEDRKDRELENILFEYLRYGFDMYDC